MYNLFGSFNFGRNNFLSGLLVSFIALPLCIAISIASGFPILSGIVTAIIGGIIVSQISGSNVTINGPAAGMIVVILDSVERLGGGDAIAGYKYTLAAIVFASVLQVITSFTQLPEKMRKFPESVIRGMMVAIGIIVILKQVFTMFGYKIPKDRLVKLVTDLPQAFLGMQIETFVIGMFVIVCITLWNKFVKKGVLVKMPVYLLVILLGSLLAFILNISQNQHFLNASLASPPFSLFVKLPHSILEAFALPDFGKISSLSFMISVFTIFAVGSLETILSAIAVDKIDHQKRRSDLKKDLRGVGIGNLICGTVGALPMIAEVVRSTANVKYGATNKWSNFFHGVFLLTMVTLLGGVLGFVPLCVLAAMLILIGWNLINVKLIKQMYHEEKSSILVITSVAFFTIYIDLLVGILAGIVVHAILAKCFPNKHN